MRNYDVSQKKQKIKINNACKNNISIVIPNRNNEKYLDSCIQSVVNQKDSCFTFIVSDNHSSDGSMNIIDSYRDSIDKFISPPRPLGYKEHLFWILEHVQTEFVIFLAGDDIAHTELIYCYRKSLEKNIVKNIAFLCSPFYYIDKNTNIYRISIWDRRYEGTKQNMLHVFLNGPICNISSVAWKVNNLKSLHIPDEIGNSIDWYLYIMMSSRNDVLLINKRLLFYRVHSASTGNSNIVAHTDNCKRLFIYLKKNEFKDDAEIIKKIEINIEAFSKVIDGKQTYSINYVFKSALFFIYKLIFKWYRHPQLKR